MDTPAPQQLSEERIDIMSVGKLLRDAREQKGLSRASLAGETGINANSITKYELAGADGGQFPPLDKLAKLCIKLEIDPRTVLAEALEDQDEDTSVFFRDSGGAEAHALSQVSKLLTDASQILRRHGIDVDLNRDEFVDAESFIEREKDDEVLPGEAAIEAIMQVIGRKGFKSRTLTSVVKEATTLLDGLDYPELHTLALDAFEEFIEEEDYPLPSDVDSLEFKKREKECERITARLIVHGLYMQAFAALTLEGLKQVAESVNTAYTESQDLFSNETVAASNLFEDDAAATKRLRTELPIHLVDLAKTGRALNLFEDKYEVDVDHYIELDSLRTDAEPEFYEDEVSTPEASDIEE